MIKDRLEDTAGYKGLHGEVVLSDTYRLKKLPFVPDVIIDLGANIGVFSRFARELFPDAVIIAVEPDAENIAHFKKFTPAELNITLIEKAIGIGQIWRGLTAANGSGATYLSTGLGYTKDGMATDNRVEKCDVETIMPDEIIKQYVKDGQKLLIKCDVEGAENTIFTHHPSWTAMSKADYLCFEIHRYARTGQEQQEVNEVTDKTLKSLEATHNCSWEHVHFYATSKKYNG